jgi:hypothetical protein
MPASRLPRVLGALVLIVCLLTACLPQGLRPPASFVAFLRGHGLAFEPGTPSPDEISAPDVMRFPGQIDPPVYGVVSCLQPPCSLLLEWGERRAVWLASFPGPLSDDGRGWALMDADNGWVVASSK